MDTQIYDRVSEILDKNIYLTLATISEDGTPWNTPVYAIRDESLSFYWISWIQADHSKNIRSNVSVSGVVYDSTRALGMNNRRCLYMKGEARELKNPEEVQKIISYFARAGKSISESEVTGQGIKRIYAFTPKQAWLNDKSESEVDESTTTMKVDVDLEGFKTQKIR